MFSRYIPPLLLCFLQLRLVAGHSGALAGLLQAVLTLFSGDGSDWINIKYVLDHAQRAATPDSPTSQAMMAVVRGADQLSAKASWSVTNQNGFLPPSNNPHDYLSWAPYHWPDCHWCSKAGRTQLAHTSNGSDPMPPTYSKPEDSPDPSDAVEPGDGGIPYEESINFAKRSLEQIHLAHHRRIMKLKQRHDVGIRPLLIERPLGTASELVPILLPSDPLSAVSLPAPLPTQLPVASDLLGGGRTTVSRTATTHAPAQAAAKTTKTTCTPSPTTSMAPSATWTRCSYVGRDGQINPDVRKLNGPGAINAISQYVLYGSISVAANKSSKHARGVVNAIDTFFLSPSTAMNPNMNFGQIVRGPGPEGSSGTFTGILDLRGLGKVVNGLMVLKSLGIPEWTTAKDQSMRSWVSRYTQWLTQSDIGKMSATRPNNHATFYVTQLAAAKLYQGSSEEAKAILTQFFKKQFGDQIAASGEQPFEAIRSRPYHYRCFNLEALIANAKLGDFLGVNFWNTRSKYGATIQTALDYAMACDPQGEEVVDLIPHVAAVAAAYGDPNGKYASFLRKNMVNYQSKPFWFYDQPAAFSERSSSGKLARSLSEGEDGQPDSPPTAPPPKIPFSCPDVFKDATSVEIDNGVFVTCDDLRPLYEAAVPQI